MNNKKVLIISVGPVPSKSKLNVEGGGLRAWGIAVGLVKNNVSATVAVPQEFNQEEMVSPEGIRIVGWSFSNLNALMEEHDSVYVLYSRPDLMRFVYEKIEDSKQLIVDLYVPIYIESLAREKRKDIEELTQFKNLIQSWNLSFVRGDFFLCANQSQYHFYNGALSVFGRNNALTFDKKILEILPYGIHSDKILHNKNVCKGKIIKKDDFMLLWFGGLYPWFNIKPLLSAMLTFKKSFPDLKLVIVGGKNPFVNEPGFMDQYDYAVNYAKKNQLLDKNIFFVDWIPYEERNNWYLESDLVINLHHKTKETIYSWRTRIVDFIWGELPIITTGGDEASEYLALRGGASIIEKNTTKNVIDKIKRLYQNKNILLEMKEKMKEVKTDFYWENITKGLAEFVKSGRIALDRELLLEKGNSLEKPSKNQKRKKSVYEMLKMSWNIFYYQGPKELFSQAKKFISKT